MPILKPHLPFVDKFLQHFSPIFTKKQMSVFKVFIYGMFSEYKRLSLSAITNNTDLTYQRLQYFFSESNWDIKELNNIRLRLIQNQRTTAANNRGVLAVDDTGCPKPYAEKTEGAQYQYCPSSGKEENCNVAVASCFVSNTKHFPVDFKPYLPLDNQRPEEFKSKLDIAKELIDEAITQEVPFSSVVVDSWYASTDLIEFVSSKKLTLVAEVNENRSILFTHPQTKQWRYLRGDQIMPLLKQFYAHKLKPVAIPQNETEDKVILTHSFNSKLKDCKTDVKVIFVFDKWSKDDDNDTHIIVTINLNMSARDAILTYLLRWGIEKSFRELKDSFCFDQYQVRHQKQIQRHWIMSFLA